MATVALRSNDQKSVYGYNTPHSESAFQPVKVFATIDLAANPTANDILAFLTVPKGHTIVGGVLTGDDIDTNATETLDIDIGTYVQAKDGTVTASDEDALGNLGVLTGDAVAGYKPEVGIRVPLGGVLLSSGPLALTQNLLICAKVNVAAATFTAGNLTLQVEYVKSDTGEVTVV